MSERKARRVSRKSTSKSTPAKKSAAKKTVTAKKSAPKKAVAKKTTKKKANVVKSSAAKKAVVKKSAPKKVTKKPASKSTEKSAANESKGNSDPQKNSAVSIETSHQIKKTDENVTIFSRVKTDNAVLLVARVLGLAFIAFGAGSIMLGLGQVYDVKGVTALTVVIKEQQLSQSTLTTDTRTTDATDTSTDTGTSIDKTPDVLFDFPDTSLSGRETLQFTIAYAKALFVHALNRDTKEEFVLGRAESPDGTQWKLVWDTTTVPDGEYEIFVQVENQYGSYAETAPRRVMIENNPYEPVDTSTEDVATSISVSGTSAESASAVTDTTISDTTSTSDPDSTTAANMSAKLAREVADPVIKPTTLYFEIQNAANVRVGLVSKKTDEYSLIGSAQQTDTTKWKIILDPVKYTAGEYGIRVVMRDGAGNSEIKIVDSIAIGSLETVGSTTSDISEVGQIVDESTLADSGVAAVSTNDAQENESLTLDVSSKIKITADSPVSGRVPVLFDVREVTFAEVYARQQNSLKDIFLGLGTKIDDHTWRFVWDTSLTPNGTYDIFAKHKGIQGYFSSEKETVVVKNETVIEHSADELTQTETLAKAAADLSDPLETFFDDTKTDQVVDDRDLDNTDDVTQDEVKVDELVEKIDAPTVHTVSKDLLTVYKDSISEEIKTYSLALRNNDEEELRRSERRLELIRENAISAGVSKDLSVDLKEVDAAMAIELETLKSSVKKTEEIVRERVGEAATKDTDKDGITDFDEVRLYNTDPFVADSDGDGFTDGAEIAGGFDPNNDAQEAVIAYESPKETGVVREDILQVTGVSTLEKTDSEVEVAGNEPAQALISGRALPNSFITLYIFSTPIIITVKTNDDGSWSYRFDKELDDGEHEIFVGVTDNAGKIVAKSNPFTFVKEAQAFTPVDAEAAVGSVVNTPPKPSLFDENSIKIALGALVMSLGFVLLMVSLFVPRHEKSISTEVIHA